jgi:hypothetical protein
MANPKTGAEAQLMNSEFPYTTEVDASDDELNHRVVTKDGVGITHATESQRVEEISPARFGMVSESLGSDNLAVATHYLPSASGLSNLGFKSVCFTGKLTTSGTTSTLTMEVRNTESGNWYTVANGYDAVAAAVSASITNALTSGFSWEFDDLNKGFFRLKLVIDNATNTNEIDMQRTPI